ncbi:MAG: YdbH domain-containing protein [Pseudomonadales bacterium]
MPGSTASDRRTGRLGRALAWAGGLLIGLVAAAYAMLPWGVSLLAPRLAPTLGLDALTVRTERPGWRGWRLLRIDAAAGGWRITADDVHLGYTPLELLRGRLQRVAVARLAVDQSGPADAAAEPGPLPDVAGLFAALPTRQLDVTALTVHVPAAGFAARGSASMGGDSLALALGATFPAPVGDLDLTAELTPDGAFRLQLAPPNATAGGAPVRVEGTLAGDHVAVAGRFALQGPVLDLLRVATGVAPGSGRLEGTVDARVPWPPGPDGVAVADAKGTLAGDWRAADGSFAVSSLQADWGLAAGELTGRAAATVVVTGLRLGLRATLERWTLAAGDGAGAVELGIDGATPADAAEMAWQLAGDTLTMKVRAALGAAGWAALAAAAPALPGEGDLSVSGEVRVPWPLPDDAIAAVAAAGILAGQWRDRAADLAVERLAADWQWRQGALAGQVAGTVIAGDLQAPLVVDLARLTWSGGAVAASGTWGLAGDPPAPFTAGYRPDSGRATVRAAAQRDVRGPLLGSLLKNWREPYDLTGGRLQADVDLTWDPAGGLGGRVGLRVDGAAGFAGATEASGISADLMVDGDAAGWTLRPTTVRAAVVDPGVPVTDLALRLGGSGERLTVADAEARLLGGRARLSDFDYRLADGSARFDVTLVDVDLARVLALEGEHFTGTGTLSGTLPVTLADNLPSVAGGRMAAAPPGGVIRVAPALAAGIGQPGLDFALRALQNFAYTELEADVDYAASGDLTLAVQLKGRNPEVESGRPIHYNLTLRENVPVLLESLRLQDRVTEGIERRVTN